MNYNQLIKILQCHRVYIQPHNMPDPDAIASSYALQQFLCYHGIEAVICYVGQAERLTTKAMTDILPIKIINAKEIQDMSQNDYIILVDGQKYNVNLTNLPGKEVACIDHHPTFIKHDCEYKDVRLTGACSTLILDYYIQSNTPVPTEVATALLFGLRIDTDNFTRGTTLMDIEAFHYLLPLADAEKLSFLCKCTLQLNDLKAYGAAIKNIRVVGEVGFAYIPFDCHDALIGMVSDFILSITEISCSVIYAKRRDGIKLSVRSNSAHLNAGKITEQSLFGFGNGGGHPTMAGGFIPDKNYYHLGALGKMRRRKLEKCFIKCIREFTQQPNAIQPLITL